VIDYVGWIALNRIKGIAIPIVLSGDTHHYSRYAGDDGVTQFITSGGGGAFLHPTHQLEAKVNVDREDDGITWLDGRVKNLTLGSDPNPASKPPKEARYPSSKESVAMLAGNFKFFALNPTFGVLLGVFYWLLGLGTIHIWPDIIYVALLVFFIGFWAYTKQQEGGGSKVFTVSIANALVHAGTMIALAIFFGYVNDAFPALREWPRSSFLLFAAEMVIGGGVVAASLFGIYLYVSSRWLNLNHNDAFSSMRLDTHRHFLRIRIKGDSVTLYPIALDKVPSRHEWHFNTEKVGSPPPVYVPAAATPLAPHLIEGPIIVRSPNHT
jgi:hypothetical protein